MSDFMTIREYQVAARRTAIYPKQATVVYPLLGLAGEVGELCNKLKKVFRDQEQTELSVHTVPQKVMEEVKKEIGDVMWYVAAFCSDLQIDLEAICLANIEKLKDRMDRGVIKGEGDNR